MKIKELALTNYRNYQELSLTFGDGLTIITGENAQGKTNLLEAIFLLSLAKSHRTNHDQELIQWEEELATLQATITTEHFEFPLELILNKKGKIAKLNHIEQSKLSHFIGKFNVILFAPEDLQLIKGSPSLRRKFIDSELGQSHPVYLQELLSYQRILKQRNAYLKQYGRTSQFDDIYFEILTEQLVEKATLVIKYRVKFIEELERIAEPIHRDLSNQREQLKIIYQSSSSKLEYTDLKDIEAQLLALFKQALNREKEQGITVYGPHRDDIIFYINDKKAQFFGSQGQQRTIVLSIKLAELELFHNMTGEYPVLLLDDVLSELDDNRQMILMSHIEDKVQTFLTTASIEGIKLHELKNADILYVEKGQISRGESA